MAGVLEIGYRLFILSHRSPRHNYTIQSESLSQNHVHTGLTDSPLSRRTTLIAHLRFPAKNKEHVKNENDQNKPRDQNRDISVSTRCTEMVHPSQSSELRAVSSTVRKKRPALHQMNVSCILQEAVMPGPSASFKEKQGHHGIDLFV